MDACLRRHDVDLTQNSERRLQLLVTPATAEHRPCEGRGPSQQQSANQTPRPKVFAALTRCSP